MKNIFLILIGITVTNAVAQDLIIDSFLEKWQHSKDYMIEIAEAMPADRYDYRPTEREMDFQAQLLHVCENMQWLGQTYLSKENPEMASSKRDSLGKAEVITILNHSFDMLYEIIAKIESGELNEKVDFFAGQKSKLQILNLLQDHVSHHRGQLVVYLNLNQVEPPRYIGW
jgi:uncharacterized damage-inducible protein DinB